MSPRTLGLVLLTLLAPAIANAQTTNALTPPPWTPPPVKPFPNPPAGVTLLQDVVIGQGGGADLHAQIAFPTGATGPLPAVIYIHGGGWRGGSYRNTQIYPLARAGYFAASIEYRLSTEARWPAQIEDCKLAVRWLRANAAQYHVDPNRIGAWGDSAGGHLVACLATMADVKEDEGTGGYPGVSSAVQAVVDFYGPTDLIKADNDPVKNSPAALGMVQQLLGATYEQNPALYKSASPVAFVKAGDPPVLIVQGDADDLVLPLQSILFDQALTKAGVPHQLLIVKDAGHMLHAVPGKTIDPARPVVDQTVFAFLGKYLAKP
jgi:acetyl esterase/lipase